MTTASPPFVPGSVVLADVRSPFLRPGSSKTRPAVLIRRIGGSWLIAGLTSLPRYADGRARYPVPNPGLVGLRRPGYLWGKPVRVCALDIERVIGFADSELVEQIVRAGRLLPRDARALRRAIRIHQMSTQVA